MEIEQVDVSNNNNISQNENITTNRDYFEKLLSPEFSDIDRNFILSGFGESIEYLDREEIEDNFKFLKRLKLDNHWTEDETMIFQSILIQEEYQGVKEAFAEHVCYRRLMHYIGSDSKDGKEETNIYGLKITGTMDSFQFYNQEVDTAKVLEKLEREADDKGKEEDDKPDYLRITYADSDGDSVEIINAPVKFNDNRQGPNCPYDMLSQSVTNFYDIDFDGYSGSKIGMLYKYEFGTNPGEGMKLYKCGFDLLRSFKVDCKCLIKVFIGSRKRVNCWVKEWRCKPGIWYNFAEQLLPNDDKKRSHMIMAFSEYEEVCFEVMGIRTFPEYKAYQTSKRYDPFKHGFMPYIGLEE